MRNRYLTVGPCAALVLLCLAANAETTIPPPPPVDYSAASSWLCRPDKQDVCGVNMDATEISADGTLTLQPWHANPDAPIDCFYIYPTISKDPGPNSDLIPGKNEEILAVQRQFARFGSVCRLFAPVYRQVTLAALGGRTPPGDTKLAYGDVLNAWNYYLEHYNKGRGVVLIGHSQGARRLIQLAAEEFDGKPLQARLVSALLIGAGVAVPDGKDVGGEFKHIPLCRSDTQTGCVISYGSYRNTSPPPDNSRSKNPAPGMMLACTNPASLGGNSGTLISYFATDHHNLLDFPMAPPAQPWIPSEDRIATPYVSLPGLLTARCVNTDRDSYLEVTVNSTPSDKRAKDITGDIYLNNGNELKTWGLHVVDMDIALGNLIGIVAKQSAAYLGR